jgi:anti-anti-sigma factor
LRGARRHAKIRHFPPALENPRFRTNLMKIDKSLHDDYAVLTLKGEFDTFYVPALQQEVENLVERGIAHVVLDMRLVKFINSTAIGAIIKAHKRCRAENGDLMIAQPSNFVRDVMRKVGIDQMITMHDSEQEAQKAIIKNLNQRELAGEAPVDHEKVMITFPDETRNKMLGGRRALLGSMANVDGHKAQFSWNGTKNGISTDQATQLFFRDGELLLKFQVKMAKKGFFDVKGKVAATEPTADGGVRVTVNFTTIADADKKALTRFADDMAFFKRELPR